MSSAPKRTGASSSNAGPVHDARPARNDAENYTTPEAPATVTSFPLNWKTRRSLSAKRRAEIIRLALGRREHGLCVNAEQFAWVLAATLGSAEAGPYSIGKRHLSLRWYGLTLESLRISVKQADLGEFSDDDLARIIEGIEIGAAAHGPKLMRAEKVGEHLQVTAAEREMFELRTIEACDESREDRRSRKADERRKKDRERKRATRGCTPRPVFEANSQEKAMPWVALGIGRSTFFDRKKLDSCVRTRSLSQHTRTDESDAVQPRDEGGADAPGPFLKIEKSKMQIMVPEEFHPVSDYVSGKGDVAGLINQAAKILKARRPKGQQFYNDSLEETLTLLSGLAMIARFERQDSSEISQFNLNVAATESAKLIQARAANDNRLAQIARRLAA